MKHARKSSVMHKKVKKTWNQKMHERIELVQSLAIVGLLVLLGISLTNSSLFADISAQNTTAIRSVSKEVDGKTPEAKTTVNPSLLEKENIKEKELFDTSKKETYKTKLLTSFDSEDAKEDWEAISGRWFVKDNSLKQEFEYGYDHSILYTKEEFTDYTLKVRLIHTKDIGGGILFNAKSTSDLHNAYMVRFSQDGGGLFWGYFNELGEFIGQGYSKGIILEGEDHLLSVNVHEDAYQVFLDNKAVSKKIPLHIQKGMIGLTTSNAVANFTRVQVDKN